MKPWIVMLGGFIIAIGMSLGMVYVAAKIVKAVFMG